jgi:hypothetical protein
MIGGMNKYILFLCIAIIITLLPVSGNQLEACSILPSTPEQLFASSSAVFFGKVASATSTRQQTTIDRNSLDLNVSTGLVEVERVWKGLVTERVIITSSGLAGVSCGPAFGKEAAGESYLFYAHDAPGPQTYEIPILGMKKVSVSDVEVLALGEGHTPAKPTGLLFAFFNDQRIGSSGAEVVTLQEFLERKGYLTIPQGVAKGYFGAITKKALMQYQKDHNIFPSAEYFGPITRKAIENEINNQ